MSRTNWGLVLLLMLIVSLISTAPARIVALLLPSNKIIIQGFSGTLWGGRASRGLIAVGPGFVHLGRIRWSVNPLSLLLFSPRLTVNAEWGNQRIDGQVTFGGSSEFGFEDFSANMSAQLVRQFAPLNVAGDLSVHLDELQIKAGIPSAGSGRVVWRAAAWWSPLGAHPLGSYAVEFEQLPGQTLTGKVVTVSGPVEATGTIELNGRRYTTDVMVSSKLGLEPQLRQAMSLLAQPIDDGFRIKLDGDF